MQLVFLKTLLVLQVEIEFLVLVNGLVRDGDPIDLIQHTCGKKWKMMGC